MKNASYLCKSVIKHDDEQIISEKDLEAIKLFEDPLKTILQLPIRKDSEAMGMLQLCSFDWVVSLEDFEINTMVNILSKVYNILN